MSLNDQDFTSNLKCLPLRYPRASGKVSIGFSPGQNDEQIGKKKSIGRNRNGRWKLEVGLLLTQLQLIQVASQK